MKETPIPLSTFAPEASEPYNHLNVGNLPAPLASVLVRYQRRARTELQEKKRPGRPTKRTPEYLRALLVEHRRLACWFIARFGREPASDRQLYTEFFADQFSARGERAGRARTLDFQRTLKTLRNELAEARRLDRQAPENGPISGT